MKIAFNIRRQNWYRVLAPIVAESLKRGYEVSCWHHGGNTRLGVNTPNVSGAPTFAAPGPSNRTYTSHPELESWVARNDVDVIVDVVPPTRAHAQRLLALERRPFWVVVDGPCTDSILEVSDRAQLKSIDLFAMRTPHHIGCGEKMIQTMGDVLQYEFMPSAELSRKFQRIIEESRTANWVRTEEDVLYFRHRAVSVGTPAYDVLPTLDVAEIRARWGVPDEQPVVALLPFPFSTRSALWCEASFACVSRWERLARALVAGRFNDLQNVSRHVGDRDVVRALRRFCDRNDACLIAKLRHSMDASPRLVKNADVIVGEDSLYPHTALELFALADLTVGYYSTGVIESVAAGTSYLNVGIPGYAEALYNMMWPVMKNMFNTPGVSQQLSAPTLVNDLPKRSLDSFALSCDEKIKYDILHNGPIDGKSSARVLDSIAARYAMPRNHCDVTANENSSGFGGV